MAVIHLGDFVSVWFGIPGLTPLEGQLTNHFLEDGIWVVENKDGVHYIKNFATMTKFSEEKIKEFARQKGKEAMNGPSK